METLAVGSTYDTLVARWC